MVSKLKVGIAGHGLVGRRRHQFIDQHPSMMVTAVSDIKYEQAHGVEDGIPFYKDYHRLIAEQDLDVLFVCLPNDAAPDATIAGLKKELHVFCEKPPGRNVADIRKVCEVEAASPGLKLKYGFNHRYHESVQEAFGIVNGKKFGKVINMRGVYGKSVLTPKHEGIDDINHPLYWRAHRKSAGGGILLDQGIHMVDLMRCFGGEFNDVKSFVSNDFWNHDVEDNAYALMQSNEGIVAMLHSSATQWRHKFSLEVTMEYGAMVLGGILSSTKSYGQETLTLIYRDEASGGNPKETKSSYIYDNSWNEEIKDFADCILADRPISIGSSQDALKTMELVYKIYGADSKWRDKYDL